VMNYPLRTALIDFLTGQIPSETAGRKLMSLYENYPKPAVEAAFNLIGSHDRARILTLLGTDLDEKRCNADSISSVSGRLDFDLALKRLWVITVLQMTLPGVPCIYYGDEAGLLGGPDPENRGTFPWGKENKNAFTIYRNAIALRKEWRVFTDGNFSVLKTESQDVFAFRRRNDEESVLVFINRSPDHSKTVHVKTNGVLYDLLSAKSYPSERQSIKIELSPCGAAVLREEKKCSPVSTDRACGVLCHITSLPSKWGIGDLGKEAEKFLLKLKQARLSYWQILPINPVDEYDSPYATSSAFAGNPYLISPEDLCARNLITKSALEDAEKKAATLLAKNNRAGIKKIKTELLRNAFSSFRPNDDYRSFCRENSYWLPDYCAFEALKEKYRGKPWQTWPKKYKENTAPLPRELESEAAFYSFCQYMFHLQWKHLLEFSHANGIAIIGDLPFYVSLSSADVWSHRDAFCLDENGYEKVTAGVPPDYFSQDGQVWNNPLYNWRRMEASGFDWWMQRLKQAFARYDLLRLDHFRGFEQYWEIPKGEKSIFGRWKFGPGCKLFQVAKETFGSLPIVAEDLGEITVQVKNLLNACGFLSTDVFQFSYHERLTEKEYLAKKNAVLYSGTHDNQTLKGWLETHHQMLQNSSLSSEEVIRLLYESDAPLVILPLQDLLGLDDNARMNTPGKAENNWKWQFSFSDFTDGTIKKMKDLAENTKR